MKKLLHAFPSSVLIWPSIYGNKISNLFTNKEFDNKITKIRKNVDQLSNIKVTLSNKSDENISLDLHKLPLEHHKRLENNNIVEEDNVKIYCNTEIDDRLLYQNSEESEVERVCNIKTLGVKWEGRRSFMHVIIDNTDIYNLEEARNNVKLQKIMFASASHEFRTPLNAIMNSFNFVKSSFSSIFI
jgi:hypothetical protein